jgi:hypothetical protein
MKYEKPQILVLESAANAIQGGKGFDDNDSPQSGLTTATAYEADE